MTEMILKWNPKFEKYGAVWRGRWYRQWLPTQQEMKVQGVPCSLQFQPGIAFNHGFYVTCDHELTLDGLHVDLPFNPLHVTNIY
ncbi:hypothetical protein [Segatella copri]|uniref:hypothetical protein n=1 Tax=Segatella copri TaxID=165179 RepID=UPI001F41A35C|nr:hypothetical protein [Segatella copri]